MNQEKLTMLEAKAKEMRRHIIAMLEKSGSGHPGGSLSCTDILTALYFDTMHVDPKNPKMADRDRLVLSKGHAAPALYTALAMKGFFALAELDSLRKLGSPLQGHPDMKKVPGVDFSTGSLGQGVSGAVGIAMAAKMDNAQYRVYAILGDGETQEGQVWEAMMFAAHYRLDNLTIFIDHNHLQIDGDISKVMSPEPLDAKMAAFGLNVLKIDGHNLAEILAALEAAKQHPGQPTVIIAETVKGKGVDYMENIAGWHGVAPNAEQAKQALAQLI